MKKVLTLGDLDSNKSLEKVKVRLPKSDYEGKQEYAFNLWFKQYKKK